MNYILRTIGISGSILFAISFWLTWGIPGYVEHAAKSFVQDKIVSETKEKIASVSNKLQQNKLANMAANLLSKNRQQIEITKERLHDFVKEKIPAIMAEMSDQSCECRKLYINRLKSDMDSKIFHLEEINKGLLDFMKGKYMEVVGNLVKDIRIFTLSNTLVFFILTLVSLLKPRAVAHLFLPAILLLLSTLICSYFYIFEQNWFYTLIYNDFVGYSYLAYLTVVFLFLCDIVFNSAQVTTAIINSILQSLGKILEAAPLSPC